MLLMKRSIAVLSRAATNLWERGKVGLGGKGGRRQGGWEARGRVLEAGERRCGWRAIGRQG